MRERRKILLGSWKILLCWLVVLMGECTMGRFLVLNLMRSLA